MHDCACAGSDEILGWEWPGNEAMVRVGMISYSTCRGYNLECFEKV